MSELIKAIKCELCGSNELVKQDDYFVCQFCGTKYTPEAAKKLIIDIQNPIEIKGVNSVDEDLANIEALINIGKLYEAEKLLNELSVKATINPKVWIMMAKFSYIKYIEEENYASLSNMTMDLRCNKCIDDLEQYKKACKEDANSQIDNLLIKVREIKERTGKEYLEYFYNTPKCFCYDYTYGTGCFPVFRYIDLKGKWHEVHDFTTGVVQEFIDDCEKNMEIYNDAVKNNAELNQLKIVSYLCGENLAQVLQKQTNWKIVGFNGYTVIIKYFYSDAWDNKHETYATNKLIKNNVNEICNEASKVKLSKIQSSQNGCYIATCVYGSYDCPEVWRLRRFRDNQLSKTWYGKTFISIYYAISPTLVKWFGETAWFKKTWKAVIDRIVMKLKDKGFEDTPYNDK